MADGIPGLVSYCVNIDHPILCFAFGDLWVKPEDDVGVMNKEVTWWSICNFTL